MGFVNGVPDYIQTVGIGSNGVVTDTTKQGGLVAIYYFGAMFGCFIGGRLGDRFGRKKAVIIGSLFTLLGGGLQAGSRSADMTLVARVICGLGIGFINAVSVYTSSCPRADLTLDHSRMGIRVGKSAQQGLVIRSCLLCQLCRNRHCVLDRLRTSK